MQTDSKDEEILAVLKRSYSSMIQLLSESDEEQYWELCHQVAASKLFDAMFKQNCSLVSISSNQTLVN